MGLGWRPVVLSIFAGVCVALASGLVENTPGGVAIPEKRHFGYPLIWRTSDPFVGEVHLVFELLADCLVWAVVFLVAAVIVVRLRRR